MMSTPGTVGGPATITIAHGDGIGPEIMAATLKVLAEAGAELEYETIEIGEACFKRGFNAGIEPSGWDALRRNKYFLKAPVTTPQGGGFKSLNVTIRTALGLFANVRPCVSYYPFVETKHPNLDVVIVRENEEDVYGGIEHQQTAEVTQCLKIISRPGSEKIARYAFRYAKLNQRKKVTCMTKDNIMKITDGLFHRVFNEVAQEFPDIETEHLIVDIGTARLADTPQDYDVVVMPNLYGDIVSDVVGQISGSVGLAGSANIGEYAAMFEAIHGSAPSIAGKDIANPSGLLLAAVMMLAHLGQAYTASAIHNAWLRTIEDGLHTADIYRPGRSSMLVGTQEFARGVIDRLGQNPRRLKSAQYFTRQQVGLRPMTLTLVPPPKKLLVGVDVFLDWRNGTPDDLAKIVEPLAGEGFKLSFITNRGSKVWPDGIPETFCTDHWRCRYEAAGEGFTTHTALIDLLARFQASGLDFIKTENLYTFDGKRGFSEAGAA
jgi:isocitrate dehydrogenase